MKAFALEAHEVAKNSKPFAKEMTMEEINASAIGTWFIYRSPFGKMLMCKVNNEYALSLRDDGKFFVDRIYQNCITGDLASADYVNGYDYEPVQYYHESLKEHGLFRR